MLAWLPNERQDLTGVTLEKWVRKGCRRVRGALQESRVIVDSKPEKLPQAPFSLPNATPHF